MALVRAWSVNQLTVTFVWLPFTVDSRLVRLKTAVVPPATLEHRVALAGFALGVTIGIYCPGGNE